MPKEVFKEKLLSLIHKFEKDKHHYLSKGYLEAEVRHDFLDPLFDALGWDIGNKKKLSPFDREVVAEKSEMRRRGKEVSSLSRGWSGWGWGKLHRVPA